MKGTTHIIGGITAATIMQNQFNTPIEEPIFYFSAAIAGAIIPDICHPNSMIGRRLPILSKTFSKIFGHRSFTHSLLFMVLIYILTKQFESIYIQAGLLVGIGSHLLLDAMTAQGIKFLYPLKTTIRTPLYVRTGSMIGESFVMIALISITVIGLFRL